jgi:hypothetical protein
MKRQYNPALLNAEISCVSPALADRRRLGGRSGRGGIARARRASAQPAPARKALMTVGTQHGDTDDILT